MTTDERGHHGDRDGRSSRVLRGVRAARGRVAARFGRRARGTLIAAVFALAGGSASGASAQELTLALGRSGSDYREFDGGVGLGADASFDVAGPIGLRASLRRHADDGDWTRSTCVGIVPADIELCPDDRFTASYSWLSAGIGPEARFAIGDRWRFTVGTLVSRIWIDGSWRGEASGVRIGRPPEGSVLGFTALASVTRWFDARWGVSLAGRVDDPQFTQCVLDAYDPFCDGGALRSVELGVTLRR